MRRFLAVAAVMVMMAIGQRTSAQQQSFTLALFERYLEALRVEAGIPGMSGVVLQGGTSLWERNFGYRDLERAIAPEATTPYAIGGLSQIFGATLLLKSCVDEGFRQPTDLVTDWIPDYADSTASLVQLLAHVQPNGAYRYDLARFSLLTDITRACAGTPYPKLLGDGVFSRLGLADSVPGTALAAPAAEDFENFDPQTLARYANVIGRMAVPYRVDVRGRATRGEVPAVRANASTGVVTSVADLARFDAALDRALLLQAPTQVAAWTRPAPHLPTGLGWFVQNYNNQAVVWQFGLVPDGYSSLIVKLPNRRLTFILLANSDGLSAPFSLENGDVTASLFARTFLRLFAP